MHNRQKQSQKRSAPALERHVAPEPSVPRAAYVQAYESQLVYGQPSRARDICSKEGGSLMQWHGDDDGHREIWADRYDILHLLDTLPPARTRTRARTPSPTPSSSSSWADLPSDVEETFYLSDPEELADRRRRKRQQWVDSLRESRLAEREEEDREADAKVKGKEKAASWPENEIPTPVIQTLMSHTAASLASSPSPQVLECRILLNHAEDERFEFLKGRWKATWDRTLKDARAKRALLSRGTDDRKAVGSLIGGYASSDDEDSGSDTSGSAQPPPPPPLDDLAPSPPRDTSPPSPPVNSTDTRDLPLEQPATTQSGVDTDVAERQRQRRLKAEEWKRSRAQKGT